MSTSTQNVKPDPGVLEPQHRRQHRWSGGKRIGAFAAAAVVLVLAAVLIIQSREEAPATDQTPVAVEAPENTVNARAEEVATGFVEAYGAFDVEQAMTYLADDATIAVLGAQDDLRLLISWLEATGYQQILDPCEEVGSSASGSIRCTFAFTPSGPARSDGVLSAAAPSISTFVTERSSKLRRVGRSRSSRLRCGSPSPNGCPRPTRWTPR